MARKRTVGRRDFATEAIAAARCHRTLWRNAKALQRWIDMVGLADHDPYTEYMNGEPIEVPCGTFCASYRSLASRWGVAVSYAYAFVLKLQTENLIEITSIAGTTSFSLCPDKKANTKENEKVNTLVNALDRSTSGIDNNLVNKKVNALVNTLVNAQTEETDISCSGAAECAPIHNNENKMINDKINLGATAADNPLKSNRKRNKKRKKKKKNFPPHPPYKEKEKSHTH